MVSFFVHILLIFCSFVVSQDPNAYHGGEMLKWHTSQLHFITIKNSNLRFFFFLQRQTEDICRISIWPNHVIHFHPRLLARYLQLLTALISHNQSTTQNPTTGPSCCCDPALTSRHIEILTHREKGKTFHFTGSTWRINTIHYSCLHSISCTFLNFSAGQNKCKGFISI